MNSCLCGLLVLLSFFDSLLNFQWNYLMMSRFTFCADVESSHIFGNPPQLFKLAHNDTSTDNTLTIFIGAILGGVPLSEIIFFYYKIISSFLRVPSPSEKYKTFSSTCGSCLSVACLFNETGPRVYLGLTVSPFQKKDAVALVIYTVVTAWVLSSTTGGNYSAL